jgi:hypothetical protein
MSTKAREFIDFWPVESWRSSAAGLDESGTYVKITPDGAELFA